MFYIIYLFLEIQIMYDWRHKSKLQWNLTVKLQQSNFPLKPNLILNYFLTEYQKLTCNQHLSNKRFPHKSAFHVATDIPVWVYNGDFDMSYISQDNPHPCYTDSCRIQTSGNPGWQWDTCGLNISFRSITLQKQSWL